MHHLLLLHLFLSVLFVTVIGIQNGLSLILCVSAKTCPELPTDLCGSAEECRKFGATNCVNAIPMTC